MRERERKRKQGSWGLALQPHIFLNLTQVYHSKVSSLPCPSLISLSSSNTCHQYKWQGSIDAPRAFQWLAARFVQFKELCWMERWRVKMKSPATSSIINLLGLTATNSNRCHGQVLLFRVPLWKTKYIGIKAAFPPLPSSLFHPRPGHFPPDWLFKKISLAKPMYYSWTLQWT